MSDKKLILPSRELYNTIQGWVMDTERLKNGGSILTEKYFEKQLQNIREMRMSKRKFYQKITDIYSTSIDYESNSAATKCFYAFVQNKLHWAILKCVASGFRLYNNELQKFLVV